MHSCMIKPHNSYLRIIKANIWDAQFFFRLTVLINIILILQEDFDDVEKTVQTLVKVSKLAGQKKLNPTCI